MSNHIADRITAFSGTMLFFVLNAVVFTAWILLNTVAPKVWHFDEYPFQFLTMAVSLEAILLSVAILISQNRQSAKDRATNERDLATDVATKQEMSEVRAQLDRIEEKLDVRQSRAKGKGA